MLSSSAKAIPPPMAAPALRNFVPVLSVAVPVTASTSAPI